MISRKGRASGIPASWLLYIVEQEYERYTAADHDVWNEIRERMSRLVRDLRARIHPAYLEGFQRLLVPGRGIPRLADIDAQLEPLGWQTVSVDGYVPAEVYAGLMARGIFPVSRNLRCLEHIAFSPTPDMAHDLFGHLPMLVSAGHRRFLRRLAGAMAAAPPSPYDRALYEANRHMAQLRSQLDCPPHELQDAEAHVEATQRQLATSPSELTHLARMYLWSVEFGLMGRADDFVIYGAGLLSAPAESHAVVEKNPKIVDYSLEVIEHDVSFSDPQMRYFVAPGYNRLEEVLKRYQHRLSKQARGKECDARAST